MDRKSFFSGFNIFILLVATLLIIYGTMIILSTVIHEDVRPLQNDFFVGHLINVMVAYLAFLIFSQIDYRYFLHLSIPLMLFTFILLGLLPFVGLISKGSARWFDLGFFSFQPSEFAKIFFILFLGAYFVKYRDKLPRGIYLAISLLMSLVTAFLVFIQPDLGTSVVSLVIWGGMVLLVGLSFWEILGMLIFILTGIPLGFQFLQNYQKERVWVFLNPQRDPLGDGYAVLQSIIAVGAGQFGGMGWGRGTQSQLRFLPERQTDFIFATLSEELGFVGVFLLVLLFSIFLIFLINTAKRTSDNYGRLIVVGVFSWFIFQITINIGMNIGLMPITGIPLPFISYGGSSLISCMIALGVVESVSKHGR